MFAVGLGTEKNLEAFVSIYEDSQIEGRPPFFIPSYVQGSTAPISCFWRAFHRITAPSPRGHITPRPLPLLSQGDELHII